MHVSVSAYASREWSPNTSGTAKGTNLQRFLSRVHKWCSYHVISMCQTVGDMKNINECFILSRHEGGCWKLGFFLTLLPGIQSTTQETLKVPLGKMPLPTQLWCIVQVALKESLPETPVNNKDLLMFHNYFPKYVIATPFPNTRNFGKCKIHMIPVKTSGLSASADKVQDKIASAGLVRTRWS